MDRSPLFVDTNVLVYAKLALSPFHAVATERLLTLEGQTGDFARFAGSIVLLPLDAPM